MLLGLNLVNSSQPQDFSSSVPGTVSYLIAVYLSYYPYFPIIACILKELELYRILELCSPLAIRIVPSVVLSGRTVDSLLVSYRRFAAIDILVFPKLSSNL